MDDDELKKLIENSAMETRRHFDVVAERLQSKIETIAEGVVAVHQRIDRLEAKMHEEFDDVRSMIKFPTTSSTAACGCSKKPSPTFTHASNGSSLRRTERRPTS